MKWYARNLEQALKGKPESLPPLVLIYGDDSGQVRSLANSLCAAVVPDPNDPFAADRLTLEDLAHSPGRLLDSAATISFGGGVRLVRVDGFTPGLAKNDPGYSGLQEGVEMLLANPPSNAVVVVPAPGLDAKAALATKVEKHTTAAAVRCFVDTSRDVSTRLRERFQNAGRPLTADALAFLAENLGNDRGVTESEAEKLELYTHGKTQVTLEDCLAVVAAAPSVNIFKLCDAVGGRDTAQADRLLQSLLEEGEDLYGALIMVTRHLRRLMQVHEAMAEGSSAASAMAKLRPPVVPMAQKDFQAQLARYNYPRLQQMYTRAYKTLRDSRRSGLDGSLAMARGIMALGV